MEELNMQVVTFKTMGTILRENGWNEIRCKGSHHQYRHPNTGSVVTVPGRRSSEVISRNVVKNIEKATGLSFA